MTLAYRPEIDGLRAIAVLGVMLYHAAFVFAGVPVLAGGFLGVDVFFVISGYLIAGILWQEMEAGSFSIRQFYERRARRILPALFLVMLVSVPMALLLMAPKELREYSGSALASLGFVSNLWFWLEDAYTAAPSAFKPLLHTWSLSVEEQFYVFFPMALVLLRWLSRRFAFVKIAPTVLLTAVLSLLLAHYGSSHFFNAAFFILPTRIWELLAGALLVVMPAGRQSVSVKLQSALSLIGLLLIGACFVLFNDNMRHPSLLTLLPVAGAMLVIGFGAPLNSVSRCLATPMLVATGLCSYSLYLWHFPVFAFARIANIADGSFNKAGLLVVSVVLALPAYHWLEKPLRNRALIGTKIFMLGIFAALIMLAGTFALLYRTSTQQLRSFKLDGQIFNIEDEKKKRLNVVYQTCGLFGLGSCNVPVTGKTNILVVGDSMAVDVLNTVGTLYPTYHFALSSLGGCPPSPDIGALVSPGHPDLQRCLALNAERFSEQSLKGFDGVIINNQLGWFTAEALQPYLEFLASHGMKHVLLLGNYLQLNRDFTEVIIEQASQSFTYQTLKGTPYIASEFIFEDQLRQLAVRYGFEFISVKDQVCVNDDCPLFIEGHPYTWDKFHFSTEFAGLVATHMQPALAGTWLQHPGQH